jgi:hypothetical protein
MVLLQLGKHDSCTYKKLSGNSLSILCVNEYWKHCHNVIYCNVYAKLQYDYDYQFDIKSLI